MAEQIITPDAVEVYPRPSEASPGAIGPIMSPVQEAMALFARLPPILKGFLLTLARDRLDEVSILTFADWLEENGCTAEGQRVRLLRPEAGGVLAVWPSADSAEAWHAAWKASDYLSADLPGVAIVVMDRPGHAIEAIDPGQLRAAGWVRAEELQAVRRGETIECAAVAAENGGIEIAEAIRSRLGGSA